jgi:hypothetical protein
MRTIITLSCLGLTLALSGAALATPASRSAQIERLGSSAEQMQNYYRHKKYYGHGQDRTRGERSHLDRRNPDGTGTSRPEVRKPALTTEPAVFREPVAREHPQIV